MKIFVGIDIAKLNHFAAAISSDGEMVKFGNINAYENFHEVVPPFPKV